MVTIAAQGSSYNYYFTVGAGQGSGCGSTPYPIPCGGTGASTAAAADYALAGNPGTGVFARNCTSGSPGTCTSTTITSNSTYVNLQYLYNFHSALSTILQNGTLNTTAAVWTMACDSWCSNGYITAPLRAQMQLQYGNGGAGYTNFASLSSYVPDWTLTGTWTSYSSDLYTLDGYSIGSSDTSTPATATLSACTTYRYANIHYEAGSYTFAWQVDSGGWNNVNASGSGYQVVQTTAGSGCHILAIKMVSGSSIISGTSGGIKGVDFQNSGSSTYVQAGGFRLNSLGHPGWTAANVVALDPTHWEAGMTALGSNLFTLQFGVNEQGANTPPATQIANYTTIISEAKAATPLIDIGMDPPSESGVTATYTIGQYAAAQEAFAVANNYAFWNTYQVMGPYATQNSLNERSNTQHLNQLGGQAFANVMTSDPTDPITLWSPTFLGATVNTNLQNQGYTICLQSTYCQHLYATHSISAGTGNSMYFSVSNGSGNPAANFYHYGNGTSLFPGTMTVDDAGQNVGYSATYGNSYPQNIQATFSNAVAGNNCWLFQNFNLSAAATAFKTCGDLSALFYGKVTVDTSSQNAGLTTTDGGAYPQTILGTFSNAAAASNCWNIGNWNLSSTVTVLTTCGDKSTSFAGIAKTIASTTAGAGLNIPPGVAPTSPNNGDCWTTSLGLYCQIAGSTVGPYGTGGGSGTVTSVGLSMPGVIFNASVPGSPVTTSGTLAPTLATQTANTALRGPASGGAATPTFRADVNADLASITALPSGLTIPGYAAYAGTTPFTAVQTLDAGALSYGLSLLNYSNALTTFATGFNGPVGLAFDASGNLYVTNYNANIVSKVTTGGVVTTFATGFNGPQGLAFDASGNLYVANRNANTVSEILSPSVLSNMVTLSALSNGVASQQNGVNPQSYYLYNTITGSNYERGVMDWVETANQFTIGTEKAGSGSNRAVALEMGGTTEVTLATNGNVGIGTVSPTWKLSVGATNQWGVDSNGITHQTIGTAIASATTIAPITQVVHVTGTTTISTITAVANCTATANTACQITIIPDGLFATTTGGNIAVATVAVVSKAIIFTYDQGTALWYPSY